MKKNLPQITALAFLLLYLGWGLIQIAHLKINGWDYGIFQQTLFDVASGAGWNPFNTIRGIFIFNEHFYPVLIPLAYLTRILGHSASSPFFIEWLSVALALVFVIKTTTDQNFFARMMAIIVIIFSRPILTAILYPVHTDTWTLLLHLTMFYGVARNRFHYVWISALSLMFFKETYAFGIVGLSSYFLLIERNPRRFVPILAIGLFFVIMELGPRRMLLGDGNYYAVSYASMILSEPLKVLAIMRKTLISGSFIKVFVAYLFPIILAFRLLPMSQLRPLLAALAYLIPLILIHLIIERFYFHHASQHGISLAAGLIYSGLFHKMGELSKTKIKALLILPFILVSTSSYSKLIKPYTRSIQNKIPYTKELRHEAQQVRDYIKLNYQPSETIFASGGMSVQILQPEMLIFHAQSTAPRPEFYQYIALERSPYGDLWPLSPEGIDRIIADCAPYFAEIVFDTPRVFIAKGSIPVNCVENKE
jgi:hypothetical protein